jgi:hypothetical protein
MGHVRFLYFYDYTTEVEANEMKHLLELGYSKHEFGNNKPPKNVLIQFTQSLLKRPKLENEEN